MERGRMKYYFATHSSLRFIINILGYCNMFVSRTLKCFSRGIKCAWLKMWLNESRAYLTYCGLNMSHDSLASIVLPITDEWDMMKFIKCPKLADSHDIDVFLFFSLIPIFLESMFWLTRNEGRKFGSYFTRSSLWVL